MPSDAELVMLARAGDREALAAIYDRYADPLYDLCSSVLRDPDAAFDAMVDTFVLAALELYRLRKPDKLESWLFALTREHLLARNIPIGVDHHAEFDGQTGGAAAVGAGAIVWEAVSWLPPPDRILLDLHARQPLDDRGVAAALGVSLPHAVARIRDLDEKVERLMSALLVARLSRPGCPPLERLIASEDQQHPDVWLRHVASHVDVCRTCLLWREDQPSAIQLIKDVPSEPAPLEVRDEVLDRIDLLWSQLGPPDWSAMVVEGKQPTGVAREVLAETTELPPEESTEATEAIAESADFREEQEAQTGADAAVGATEVSQDVGAGEEDEQVDVPAVSEESPADEYDEFEEVESLLPPPPRLRRSGFPRRSMYPRRRRRVLVGTLLLAGLISAALVLNFRGFSPEAERLYTAEANAGARQAPVTTPAQTTPTTAPPTTAGPDTRAPFVFNLATVYGCIGPTQTTTTGLATVVDAPPGRLATVELVFVDAVGKETRNPMTRSGGNYEGPIGPYEVAGNITWRVVATDAAGNRSEAPGPAVAASPSC
ncbi:MAG TPA: sigma-70 family RNA polymerase sigma factor [Acidimicrobiia bacterium]|nr:sigma-70 family RNA polymerase sigma factor [Acidimicrobiia bacterium]